MSSVSVSIPASGSATSHLPDATTSPVPAVDASTVGDIAIIGMACRFPGAAGPDEFWQLMRRGESSVSEVPAERWDLERYYSPNRDDENKTISKWGGFIADVDKFDAPLFRISPREAELMDPQQRIMLELAWTCIEDAGYAPSRLRGSDTGVYIGLGNSDYKSLMERSLPSIEAHLSTGVHFTLIPNRISYEFDFKGPSVPLDTACSGSLVALDQAVHALRRGDCSTALVGGVSVLCSPTHFVSFSKAGMLSSEGQCRSFDERADGYVRGEGGAFVLLKPLAQALRDRDEIYGVIKGTAVNHGGKVATVTSPNPFAQSQVIVKAFRNAKVSPASVTYIEAQGTGTPKGDPLEVNGLVRAYTSMARSEGIELVPGACAIGTVKTNIGHLEPVSGMAGLIKVLLAMQHQSLPALANFRKLNPRIKLDGSPFRLVTEHSRWEPAADGLRRAGISSFGFGGVNAHVVVESFVESRDAVASSGAQPWLFVLSAKTSDSLQRYVVCLLDYLMRQHAAPDDEAPSQRQFSLEALAYSLQQREAMEERIALIASSLDELIGKLQACLQGGDIDNVWRGSTRQRVEPAGKNTAVEVDAADIATWLQERQSSQLAAAWVKGAAIASWDAYYAAVGDGTPPLKLRIPTYQFARKRYWFADVVPTGAPSTAQVAPLTVTGESVSEVMANTISQSDPMAMDSSPPSAEGIERLQRTLLQMAARLLKQSAEDIDTHIELAEYGFDSIAYTGFASRISARYAIELAPTVFFDHPTIAGIAAYLWAHHRASVSTSMDAMPASSLPSAIAKGKAEASGPSETFASKQSGGFMPVAIIGMSGAFPMARDTDEFWRNLEQGRDCIGEVPAQRWDWQAIYGEPGSGPNRCNVKWGGFIDGIDEFDPLFFGISPREALLMDPQQRLLMMHVWRAVEDAGYSPASLSGTNTGVFVGATSVGYESLVARANLPVEGYSATAIVPSVGPNRMSFLLDLHGPSEPIETACSSSLVAIHRAVMAMQTGECDQAIVGGVNIIVTPDFHISFNKAGMLAPDGRCKTFSSDANGYVRGEGVGMLFLKPLDAAERDGDHIHGVIRGSAENHGGRANSLTSPNSRSQADVLVKAHTRAGIDPRTVTYLETHGTGTSLGDPVEINGIKAAFKTLYDDSSDSAIGHTRCALASVKTNIGHLEIAAGVAGVIKVLLQFRHRRIARSLHCEEINPLIDLSGTPFHIAREAEDWVALKDSEGHDIPRRAGVSSFGFGGVNAHVVLEEYTPRVDHDRQRATTNVPTLVPVSARTGTALREYAQNLIRFIEQNPELRLQDLAYTLQIGRKPLDERLGVVAHTLDELQDKLRGFVEAREDLEDVHVGQVGPHREALGGLVNDEDMQATLQAWHAKGKFGKLLNLWVKGVAFDWSALYRDLPLAQTPRRISAPTYPFARDRYWIGMAAAGASAVATSPARSDAPAAAAPAADRLSARPGENDPVLQALRALESGAFGIEQAISAVAADMEECR